MSEEPDGEFREFMRARWPAMVRLAYGLTGDLGHAEDVAQMAFAKAYAAWSRVRRAGNPEAYVRRIVINENLSRFRRRRVTEQLTDAIPESGGIDATVAYDDHAALMAALRTLSHRQRTLIVLRYWLDLSEAEIAAAMNCPVGTIKSQTSRALARLRSNPELVQEEL